MNGTRLVYSYFIEAPQGEIKVGQSHQPKQRLRDAQIGSPVPLTLLGVCLVPERDLHARFQEHRLHGEWFSAAIKADVVALIEEYEATREEQHERIERDQRERLLRQVAKVKERQEELRRRILASDPLSSSFDKWMAEYGVNDDRIYSLVAQIAPAHEREYLQERIRTWERKLEDVPRCFDAQDQGRVAKHLDAVLRRDRKRIGELAAVYCTTS